MSIENEKLKSPRYRCDVCPKEYSSQGALNFHKKHHKRLKVTPGPDSTSVDPLIHPEPSSPFANIAVVLYSHNPKTSNREAYELCNYQTLSVGKKTLHKCGVCSKTVTSRRTAYEHALIHLDEKPYQCNLCDESFRQARAVKTHIADKHPDINSSSTCDNLLSMDGDMNMSGTDSNKDGVDCTDVAGDVASHAHYSSEITTPDHRASNDANSVAQEALDDNSKHASTQEENSNIPEGNSSDLKCKCLFCGKAYHSINLLIHHVCSEPDGMPMFSPVDQTKPRGVKRERKSFKCDVCGHTSRTQFQAVNHSATHNTRRQYGCALCQASYKSPSNLVGHIRARHKDATSNVSTAQGTSSMD